jgi:hypothetical protein
MAATVYAMPGVAPARPVCRGPSSAVVYRRRRVVVASLVLGVLLGGRVVLGPVGGGPLSAPRPVPSVRVSEQVHVVQPGDTLWTIARTLQPEGDIRRLVDHLAAQRHGAALQVGERIALP